MKQNLSAFIVGIIFALGLGVSGMTQPQKVLGFLDIFGLWDPSLIFVMGGAVGFHLITYKLIRKKQKPIFDNDWHITTNKDISVRLVGGSLIFGIGWGLAGYCPGPALVSIASGRLEVLYFVSAMVTGMIIFKLVDKLQIFKKI